MLSLLHANAPQVILNLCSLPTLRKTHPPPGMVHDCRFDLGTDSAWRRLRHAVDAKHSNILCGTAASLWWRAAVRAAGGGNSQRTATVSVNGARWHRGAPSRMGGGPGLDGHIFRPAPLCSSAAHAAVGFYPGLRSGALTINDLVTA